MGGAGTFTAEAVSWGGSRHPTTGLTPAPQTVKTATLIPQRDYNLTDRISLLILRDLLPTRRMPPAGWSRIPGKFKDIFQERLIVGQDRRCSGFGAGPDCGGSSQAKVLLGGRDLRAWLGSVAG